MAPGVSLGRRIRLLRRQRGYSQGTLARRAQVSQPYLSMVEAGRIQSPSLPVLERVARALGVRLAALFE